MEEDAVLYAIKYAIVNFDRECVTPREVSQFILPEARVGVNEPWETAKDIMDQLERSHYLEKCSPIEEIAGYQSYKFTKTGEERAANLGHKHTPFPPITPIQQAVELALEEHERREELEEQEERKRTRLQRALRWLAENAISALIGIIIGIALGILLALYGLRLG
jgi:hypothetical protein